MREKLRYVETIACTDKPILITGESGVGKELLARAIHRLSNRPGRFVCENIAGLDDTMMSDTLFGHARGAFTSAQSIRKGLIEEAAGGTLLLDEIGDMAPISQVKLLRFIEQREYRSLGSDRVHLSDARVVLATNADLEGRLAAGTFRKDLFYRLDHRIDLPPLRNRLDDLPCLVEHFVAQAAEERGRDPPEVPQELIALLRTHDFPGNVRELRNMIENALCLDNSTILSLSYFEDYLHKSSAPQIYDFSAVADLSRCGSSASGFPNLREMEESIVCEAVRRSNGNQNAAARLLGLSPSALSRRISKYGRKRRN